MTAARKSSEASTMIGQQRHLTEKKVTALDMPEQRYFKNRQIKVPTRCIPSLLGAAKRLFKERKNKPWTWRRIKAHAIQRCPRVLVSRIMRKARVQESKKYHGDNGSNV